jgi:hypothetical protein
MRLRYLHWEDNVAERDSTREIEMREREREEEERVCRNLKVLLVRACP